MEKISISTILKAVHKEVESKPENKVEVDAQSIKNDGNEQKSLETTLPMKGAKELETEVEKKKEFLCNVIVFLSQHGEQKSMEIMVGQCLDEARKIDPEYHSTKEILHFKNEDGNECFYYANLRNSFQLSMDLVNFEAEHQKKKGNRIEGIKCVAKSVGDFPLKPWIIQTYKHIHKSPGILGILFTLLVSRCISYFTYFFDMVSDAILGIAYYTKKYDNDTSVNVTCPVTNYTMSCVEWVEDYGECEQRQDLSGIYSTAFIINILALSLSIGLYLLSAVKFRHPKWAKELIDDSKSSVRFFLRLIFSLCWPVVHVITTYKYLKNEGEVDSFEEIKERFDEVNKIDDGWKVVRIMESTFENVTQMCLQIFVMNNTSCHMNTTSKMLASSAKGIINTLSLGTVEASTEEKGFGKIVFTLISMSWSLASLKTNKPGTETAQQLLRNAVMFISMLLQNVARFLALYGMLAMKIEYLIPALLTFLTMHFTSVLLIFLFEPKITNETDTERFWLKSKSPIPLPNPKLVLSVISSLCLFLHVHGKGSKTFASNFLFQLLILTENLLLSNLPQMAPHMYDICKQSSLLCNLDYQMILFWFAGGFIQVIIFRNLSLSQQIFLFL